MRWMPREPWCQARLMLSLAAAWSIALLVAALTVPAYGSATLVAENGHGVLIVVGIPLVLTCLAWSALWLKATRASRPAGYAAWACVGILAVLCLLGILSVGIYMVPVALLLARAAATAPRQSRPAAGVS